MSAAHACLTLAVVAICGLELPGAAVVESPGLFSERLRLPFAVAARAGPLVRPACVVQNAGHSAARNLSPQAFPVFPVVVFLAGRVLSALPAPYSVAAQRNRAADNGNSSLESAVAPLAGDTGPSSTAAGKLAAVQVPEPRGAPIGPNRLCVVPNHDPSDDPNVVVRHAATRESTRAAGGSSARGFAGRTPAQPLGP